MRITVKNCAACLRFRVATESDPSCEESILRTPGASARPGGCSQTRKPASDKEKRCFTPFAAGVRYEKIRFIGDGVRKSLRGSKHIKEFGDRCHKENTSIKRIETHPTSRSLRRSVRHKENTSIKRIETPMDSKERSRILGSHKENTSIKRIETLEA